jgi:hypothetical protein
MEKPSENGEHMPFKVTLEDKEEVLNMRKLELLIDLLQTLDSSNSSELYGIKINIVDKIDRLVDRL